MKQLDTIIQKEMTRKEFLGTLGFGIASILGFSSILRFVFGKGQAKTSSGYGANSYGSARK